jgi:hypothetical protein
MSAWNDFLRELQEFNQLIGSLWRPILLLLSILLLWVLYNLSETQHYLPWGHDPVAILDTRTGTLYVPKLSPNANLMPVEDFSKRGTALPKH